MSILKTALEKLDSYIDNDLSYIKSDFQLKNLNMLELDLESILGFIEDEFSQVLIGFDKIEKITKKLPMEGKKGWKAVDKLYKGLCAKREDVCSLKTAVEAEIARSALEEKSVQIQPDESDEAVEPDTDATGDGKSIDF